ncbi:MAG: SusD/RagB family nutrient-binding outer membrane lipoprotein [Bacteroidetes bacterium]|nr:SusD/RagB family nutrient-binding outer membrane lipoprotein [Bacteroidota bacterium]
MKKYFLFIAAILILGSSCKKDFLSVNESNPNIAASVPGNLILPAALSATVNIMDNPKNWDFVYLWYGIWSISGGYTINSDLSQYNIRNSSYQGNWDNLYLAAKSFDDIEKASTTTQASYSLAIAKIMKAYIFQNLVDLYGDVPYTEAFKGSANLKPKYDKQQTIYEDLITQIDAGLAAIKAAPSDVYVPKATEDIMYSGDMTKWVKLANTLKLRILLHQSGMAGRDSYIKAHITTAGGFIGAGEGANVNPGYLLNAGQMNPTYAVFYTAAGANVDGGFNYYKAHEDIVDYMWNNANYGDLRIFALFQPYSGVSFKGNYFGVGSQLSPTASSSIGTGNIQTYNQSAPILTDVESLFLQAEAAQRGYIGTTADAKTYYDAALLASYTYFGLTTTNKWSKATGGSGTTDYNTFIKDNAGDGNFDFSAATDKLKLIITQKWVSLSGMAGVEIWTDYRRTGFPTGLHWSTTNGVKNTTPPIRLLYPQNEISRNGDNVPAIGRNAADLFSAKIFWQNR